MTLAIFDLDNTLIGGDSDHLWGDFLVERGIVDAQHYKETNDQFYEDYKLGRLDILAYLRFALAHLAHHDVAQLQSWHQEFMAEKVDPIMLPKAIELLAEHRRQGHFLLIITATNDFVTAPIAERLNVDGLIATTAALHDGRYTGDITGTPCYREGKVVRLRAWLEQTGHDLSGSYFYSDSHTDLPLLEIVSHPIAVDADPVLTAEAQQRGWNQISLR